MSDNEIDKTDKIEEIDKTDKIEEIDKTDILKDFNLKNEQKIVYNRYLDGKNLFVTGPGGTGKTHLIKAIVKHATENKKQYKVCALTGCAAILLMCGATTLHAFAGIGLATESIKHVVDKVIQSRNRKANWHKTDILIIDEVSMLSVKVFIILDLIARKIRKKPNLPFGGIQVIFSGDFYQLPPVGNEDDPETTQFCFECGLWNETFHQENQIQLKTMFRQTDEKYIKILNNIRVGKITKSMIATLSECVNKKDLDEAQPTILLPRRRDADKINNTELNKLDKSTEQCFNICVVPPSELSLTKEQFTNINLFTTKQQQYEIDILSESIMPEKDLYLRIGTRVMCVINLNVESHVPIINGSQGVVTEFNDKGYPMVEFSNGTKQIIGPHIWMSEKLPGIAIKQIPLIYAWAITIHKAQGVTLEKALIDLGSQVFECGQTYVALSRIKTLLGLYLKAFDYRKITVNKKVQQYYNKLTTS